jgi:hypothetical protein
MRKLDTDIELRAEIDRVRREFIHLSTSDVELVARGRLLLKFDDMKGLKKMTSEEMFADWYASLSPEERARYRRRQRLIDDRLADSERRARQGSSQASDVLTASGAEHLSATERSGYGSGAKAKSDSLQLQKLAADFGIAKLASYLAETGDHRVTEFELGQIVKEHCQRTGESVAKIWATDTALQKAAEVCRRGEQDRIARRDLERVR